MLTSHWSRIEPTLSSHQSSHIQGEMVTCFLIEITLKSNLFQRDMFTCSHVLRTQQGKVNVKGTTRDKAKGKGDNTGKGQIKRPQPENTPQI